ncbi:MAG: TlpA disulfide reductase family protein [Chitinophagaceae bacterium]
MKTILFLFLAITFFLACNNKKEEHSPTIIIKGNITGVPDGKIYLAESRKWKTPIDSTTIKGGHFQFKTKSSSPFLAAIHYWDSSQVKRLLYRNHTLGADSMQTSTDAFFVEPGNTSISGDNSKPPYLRIVAGKENQLLFSNQFLDFGWVGNLDSVGRLQKIAIFKKTIQQNPFSFFLLESIYRSGEQYSKTELKTIFSLFKTDVQQSKEGDAFKKYIAIRPDDNTPFPNLSLLTPENTSRSIFDSTAKINMLVFWASWCAPCRKEVPLLKEIEKKYNSTGLKISSISIDEKKEQWLKAVAYEKMNWQQVHVPLTQIADVQNQFRFVTIPLIIFTDNKGREIKRFADYDPENISAYESLINQYVR